MSIFGSENPNAPIFQPYVEASGLGLQDVEAVRLVLRGDSIVDWHRLNFEDRDQVDSFLRLNLFDPESPEDQTRIRYLHQEAVQYLRNHFNLSFPRELLYPTSIHELFLHASFAEPRFNRYRLLSCIILKVMCILHHVEARSLLYRTPVSDMDLFALVQDRVDAFSEAAQRADVPLVHIYGSRKSRDSMLTKLLSKRDTLAATVFDRLRYRVVVERHADLVPALAYMLRTFVPFNYTIPEASANNLVLLDEYLKRREDLHGRLSAKLSNYPLRLQAPARIPVNVFSAPSYKMVSFIVDLPLRVDSFLRRDEMLRFGRIAFMMVEFQMMDLETDASNERGENSHVRYKARQRERVLERLRGGAFQPLRTSSEGSRNPQDTPETSTAAWASEKK